MRGRAAVDRPAVSAARHLRLVIVTDAWTPQVNGVVHSLERMRMALTAAGDGVTIIHPGRFRTVPCPTYPEIPLSLTTPGRVRELIDAARPDAVHIATEGPLGWLARRACTETGRGFTTSYHTKFPEYVRARIPVPESWIYGIVRRFHNRGLGCMVAAQSLREDLAARGFRNLMHWPRGVDAERFRPRPGASLGLERPVFLNVGRVAVEKNIEAFAGLDLPGTKAVVGDGPALEALKRKYPGVHFLGLRKGEALARAYAAADVFVFPSLTDTFGNVLLEALASGVPVAAYPVTGPKDVILDPRAGVLDDDLERACLAALALKRADARAYALKHTWENSARMFRDNILRANGLG
jgi:glycosyltransferase involved in cell wall biosynthesis